MFPLLLAAILQPISIDLVGQQQWVPTRLEAVPFVATVGSRPDAPAIRLTAPALPESKPWLSAYSATLKTPRDGSTVVFEAYLRSPDRHKIEIRMGEWVDGWLHLTHAWQRYRLVGRVPEQTESPRLEIWLGDSAGEVDLADVRVLDLGIQADNSIPELRGDDYEGINSDDWRVTAEERIKRLRMGEFAVTAVDAAGRPVPACPVEIVQERSFFRFGTEIGAQSILDNDPTSLRLREELLQRFNTVTLGNELKWMNSDAFSSALATLPWIRAQHLALRGHTLVWGSFHYSPHNLAGRTPTELRTALHEHLREYVDKLGDDVYAWDVVNEAVWEHDFWDAVGWAEFPEAFREVRRLNPRVLLAYNDFVQHRDMEPQGYASWRARVQQLTDANAPFDLLGDQCHMEPPFIPVGRLLQRWDDMARLGRRLEITEFDVSTPDDKLQATYLRDFLTAAFSQPAIDGVILWGFYEGRMWKSQGALFRQDWTPRPALAAFDDLVLRDWRTRARLVTDTSGHIAVPAFFGTYLVTIHTPNGDRSAEIEHTPDHLARVVFRLPGISRQP